MWIALSIVLIILFLVSLIVIGFLILFIKSNIIKKTKKIDKIEDISFDNKKNSPKKEQTNNDNNLKTFFKENISPEEQLFMLEQRGGMDEL